MDGVRSTVTSWLDQVRTCLKATQGKPAKFFLTEVLSMLFMVYRAAESALFAKTAPVSTREEVASNSTQLALDDFTEFVELYESDVTHCFRVKARTQPA